MNRKYFAALFIVAVVLIVFRVGFSLVQWGDSQDPDPWKVLGDTNKYVITGHYSPSEMQSTYYGAYSVGLQAVLAALSVFTGVDLITLALYFLQIATPLVMVIVAYIITSRSGKDTTLVIPVMILLVGSFLGITRQQSRMIEENVGFILFCGALLFLYLYYNKRASRRLTFSMLTIILLASIFTHHISFLMIALLAMPFLFLHYPSIGDALRGRCSVLNRLSAFENNSNYHTANSASAANTPNILKCQEPTSHDLHAYIRRGGGHIFHRYAIAVRLRALLFAPCSPCALRWRV